MNIFYDIAVMFLCVFGAGYFTTKAFEDFNNKEYGLLWVHAALVIIEVAALIKLAYF